jgi:hypothetical protein
MAIQFTDGKFHGFNDDGTPLVGGLLYTYVSGTTTPQATYTDSTLTAQNTNPVVLDSRGEAAVWLGTSAYTMKLLRADSTLVWSQDGISDVSGALAANLASSANGSGADLVGGVGRVVSNITALRALAKTGVGKAVVLGYYTSGDGGGGQYYYDSTDTTSADNGGTIIVASDGGRWKLQATGRLSMKQFGAKVDNATDDSSAFVSALATGQPLLVPGRMVINSAITLPSGYDIQGIGKYQSAIVLAASGSLTLAGSAYNVYAGKGLFSRIGLVSADSISSLSAANLNFQKVQFLDFEEVVFYHVWANFDDHHFCNFERCDYYGGAANSQFVSQCTFQPAGNNWVSEAPKFTKCYNSGMTFVFYDTVEPQWVASHIFGSGATMTFSPVNATGTSNNFFQGPILIGNTFDSVDGVPVTISYGGANTRIEGNWFSGGRTLPGPGLKLVNCVGLNVIGNHFEWCGLSGIRMDGCTDIGIHGNEFVNMASGDGVTAATSQRVTVTGNRFLNISLYGGSGTGSTGYAIQTPASDAVNFVVIGNTCQGLLQASCFYVVGSSGNVVRDNPGQPYSTWQGWPSGTTAQRPTGIGSGFQYYDATLGKPIWWNSVAVAWKDAAGNTV